VKKTLVSGVGCAAVLVALFGSGSAAANPWDDYAGQTYEEAASSISDWGTPVIATRVGSYLPTEQCMVTGSRDASFLDSSGYDTGGVLLDLNCNDTSAFNGHPGNSVATPEGKNVKLMRDSGTSYSEQYAKAVAEGQDFWCGEEVEWCQKVCTEGGTCSAELTEFLGL